MRIGSAEICFLFKSSTSSSKLLTSNAKCLNPKASGLDGLIGGLGERK
jgi:hypothetical protein